MNSESERLRVLTLIDHRIDECQMRMLQGRHWATRNAWRMRAEALRELRSEVESGRAPRRLVEEVTP